MCIRDSSNLGLILVLNLLVKPFYILGIDAGVQDAVGATVYGGYAALLSLGFLLNIVLDLGITNYNTRHIAQHTHLMGKYFSGVVGVRFVLAGLYTVLSLGVGSVSYTHLRAHETVLDLVCRLLLEKKTIDVSATHSLVGVTIATTTHDESPHLQVDGQH